jgi:hypothetical protein
VRRRGDALVLIAILVGIAVLGYLASTLFESFFEGVPPSVPVAAVTASCASAGGARCDAVAVRLNPGRFHVRSQAPASSLTLAIQDQAAIARARVLLVRARTAGGVALDNGEIFDVPAPDARAIVRLPEGRSWNRLTFESRMSGAPVVLDEIGLFESDAGLTRPLGQPLQRIRALAFYNTLGVLFALAVCGVAAVSGFAAPAVMGRYGPWLLGALCFVICLLEVQTNYSPYWKYDLRSFYASEMLESGDDGNLTGGLYVGARAYAGEGLTYRASQVEWQRMPGYGLFCAAAAAIGRTRDIVELAMIVILLQIILYAVSVAVFVAVAPRLFPIGVSILLGVLLMLLPKQLHYTQSDSVITPIAILLTAALIVCLAELERTRALSFGAFLVANAAFALWFVVRNDVLPGWFVVTAILAGWHLRHLVVPAALAVAIAATWGLYKRPYRHEFDLLPTNTGEVFFLSLCDVSNTLRGPCTDDGYVEWIGRVSPGSHATSQTASRRAVIEVIRYWITYPVHFTLMVLTKLDQGLTEQFWSGVFTRFNKIYGVARAVGAAVYLVGLMIASLAVGHERRRVFVLGWAVFLNMPLYLVVWSSNGRFFAPAGVALLAACVPLFFDRTLYDRMRLHWLRVVTVAGGVALFLMASTPIETWIVRHPATHYWAPLLDPRGSSLVAH